jgi:methionine biosynthesis protein MetW
MNLIEYYDEYWREHGDNFDTSRLEIIARLVRPGDDVLEVDCGPGVLATMMAQRGATVRGTDMSGVAVERAAAKGIPCQQVDLDSEPLPFADDSFGTVVSNSAIEHRFFSERSLAECIRVLKPGGTFILCLPNTAHWICRLWLLFGRFPYVRNSPLDATHLRFFTVHEAKALCRKYGARPIALDGHASLWVRGFYPRPLRWPPVAAVYNRLAHIYPSLFARDFVLVCRKEGRAA